MKSTSLYVHIPFCSKKCNYCDFPSYANMEGYIDKYIDALCKEIASYNNYEYETVFIGGGTPTYLSSKQLFILLKEINKLKLKHDAEITIECNPGTVDDEKIRVLKEMGVNRISIGLQSTSNKLLENIGRIHTYEKFLDTYKSFRKMGFSNINIDLMYGLPGQSVEDYKKTLKDVISLNPEHISCYSLIVEENTPFYKMYKEHKLSLPKEEEEREMTYLGNSLLKDNNYLKYEISNFSKVGLECRHNIVYWETKEYIGCGLGAHSYLNGARFSNVLSLEKYIDLISCGKSPTEEIHKNNILDDMEEYMFMGLRMIKGVSISEFNKRFNKSIFDVFKGVISKYEGLNLLRIDGDMIFLSERGLEVSNVIMRDFILTV